MRSDSDYANPLRLLVIIMASIFVVEFGIMLAFQFVYEPPQLLADAIDGLTLMIIVYPVLYFFAFRPLRTSNADLVKFKLAVDNASDHVVITDPDAKVIYVNKACEKITGYTSDEVVGQKAGKLWGNLMERSFYETMWRTIKTEKKVFVGEMTNKRKNGSTFEVSVSISPILNSKGDIIFFVGLERDITREKETDRAKSEFISLATHQMRTPLTAINWYAEMLLDGDAGALNEKQQEFFKEIYAASKRMGDIIKSFLHILRLETGRVALKPVQVALQEVFASILREAKLDIDQRQIQVIEQYQSALSLVVDRELIRVVLQNLVSNAIKYSPKGGTIALSLMSAKKGRTVGGTTVERDSLVASVQDAGIGIAADDRDKIFTKFFRTDNAKRQDPNGNGLGLYMTKVMVGIMGGSLWFTSEEGKGTTFYVLLPVEDIKLIY